MKTAKKRKEEDKNMSQAKRGIAAAAGFCLLFVLILLVMAMTAYNMAGDKGFLAAEMRRHSSPKYSGLPDEEYQDMGQMVADYLMGRRDAFQYYFNDADGNMMVCFSPHEENHMADCRVLIRRTGLLRWFLGAAAVVLLGAGVALRKYRKSFSTGMLVGFGVALVGGLAVLVWGLVDFNSLFTVFHRLLFTNDGWLMDARTDMLVRLMPTSFFTSLGIKMLLAVTAVALVCFTAAMTIRMVGENGKQEEPDAEEAVQDAGK